MIAAYTVLIVHIFVTNAYGFVQENTARAAEDNNNKVQMMFLELIYAMLQKIYQELQLLNSRIQELQIQNTAYALTVRNDTKVGEQIAPPPSKIENQTDKGAEIQTPLYNECDVNEWFFVKGQCENENFKKPVNGECPEHFILDRDICVSKDLWHDFSEDNQARGFNKQNERCYNLKQNVLCEPDRARHECEIDDLEQNSVYT
jgi:hypothetical protein